MDNDFYFEDTSPKKVKTLIIIIGVVFLIIAGLFIIYTRKYTLSVRNDLIFELGSEVPSDITKYITNNVVDPDDYQILLNKVSITDNKFDKVGKYSFKVKYKNVSRNGVILVRDTVAPLVQTETLTVGLNEEFIPDDLIKVCDDLSKPCKASLKDEDDLELSKKAGTYNINIIVSDSVGNKVEKKATLVVKKGYSRAEVLKSDLKIAYSDPSFKDWKEQLVIKFNKAVMPDEIEESNYYTELMEFTMSDMHEYLDPAYENNLITESQLMTVYNRYGYIIGYAVRVDLDNGLHFYLTK